MKFRVIPDLVFNFIRHQYRTCNRKRLDSGGKIYAITKNMVLVDNYISHMQTHAHRNIWSLAEDLLHL